MKKVYMIFSLLSFIAIASYSQMKEQWSSKYNGPFGYDDFVSDIVVDALGNVYVTGSVLDSIAGTTDKIDFATIKYNSSGVQEWSAIYNGPADREDWAFGLDVDENGNVYVTGGSMGTDTTEEWATIKYNSFGVQLWVQRWQGLPGAGHNRALDIVVDALGNTYVTGYGEATTYDDIDYVTIKYNTDGVQEWISFYSQIPNYPSGWDKATSITLDNIGNIYVTGSSFDTATRGTLDIATIKYNPTGVLQWVSRHPGSITPFDGTEIITDNLGNVFVTGLYTIKYNSDGVQQTLDTPYGFTGTSLAVDLSGNLYVTGMKYGSPSYTTTTIKYNTSGDSLWSRNFKCANSIRPRLAFDNCLGYIYVASTIYIDNITFIDFFTVRYNSIGDSLWSARYNTSETSSDQSVAIAVDEMANVYVTGYSSADPYSTRDFATVKYTPLSFFIHAVSNNDEDKEIKDNSSTSDSTFIDCSLSNYTIAEIKVKLDNLIHEKDSDLEIYLSHTGFGNRETITDTLVYLAGGSGQNFTGTLLGDSAMVSINDGTAPFTGFYRPHSPLSKFNGLSMEGYWILKIVDRATGNEGVLKSWSIEFGLTSQPIGIREISEENPDGIFLSQNYPNPFNTFSKIKFDIPWNSSGEKQVVSLTVFDVSGKEVAILVNEKLAPGSYEVEFNGTNLPGGVYFYKLVSGNFLITKKMVLMK